MGDRVAVLKQGLLQQVDVPRVLYERPANLFVAGFIGSPAMNLVDAALGIDTDHLTVSFGSTTLGEARRPRARPASRSRADGRRVVVGIRRGSRRREPRPRRPDVSAWPTVDLIEALGAEVLARFTVDAPW